MMQRQILASSAVLVATAAAAAASATIWVLLTQPASAVVALSNGDLAEFLYAVLGAISQALWRLFEYL
jgi:hypothetical protein